MPTRDLEILETRALDDDEYEIVIAANGDVGSGKPVDLARMDIAEYMRNPVVLWNHRQDEIPIGKTTHLERDGEKIRARFKFAERGKRAQEIKEAWDDGIIQAASIGWKTRDQQDILKEWSILPLGVDPDALRDTSVRALASLLDEVLNERREDMAEDKDTTTQGAPPEGDGGNDGEQPQPLTAESVAELLGPMISQHVSEAVDAAMAKINASNETGDSGGTDSDEPSDDTDGSAEQDAEAAAALAATRAEEILHRRSDLIQQATPFLPSGFDIRQRSEEDILRAALEIPDGEKKDLTVDYMRGQLDMLASDRQRATDSRQQWQQRREIDVRSRETKADGIRTMDELNTMSVDQLEQVREGTYETYVNELLKQGAE